MGTATMTVSLGTNNWSQYHFVNAVMHPIAGKQMEYMALMNDSDLQPLWKRGFSNEAGRLLRHSMKKHMFLCGTTKHT
jgi:hypothetical protein